MNKFIIISDLNDFNNASITHFSLDKGYNLGVGLKNNNMDVYYLTTSKSETNKDNIKLININEANLDFLLSCDFIIIVREAELINQLETYTDLKKIFFKQITIPSNKAKIIIKSDSVLWALNKDLRKYISTITSCNGSVNGVIKWINNNIDYICVQNIEFVDEGVKLGFNKKILIPLNMAVLNNQINFNNLLNPYDVFHSRCRNTKKLNIFKPGDGIYPKYYDDNSDNIEILNEMNVKKKIIVYVGRIKTDGGKIANILSDIMKNLDDFELHIFPGSFVISGENTLTRYSARNINHLIELRNKVFSDNKNVFIHYPFNHSEIYNYLCFADCGIDFSSSRPENKKSLAGNAKLLEYCSAGLPVVCERNINNSFLVDNANNGILLDNIASVDDYVINIKKLLTLNIDRIKASNITIQNENCDKRAQELLKFLNVI
jgi:hypothetical protein